LAKKRETDRGGLKNLPQKAWRLAEPSAGNLPLKSLSTPDIQIGLPATPPDPANTVIVLEMNGDMQPIPSVCSLHRPGTRFLRLTPACMEKDSIMVMERQILLCGWMVKGNPMAELVVPNE
jgi:hypothetical protein